jgi:hypothetical protein
MGFEYSVANRNLRLYWVSYSGLNGNPLQVRSKEHPFSTFGSFVDSCARKLVSIA